MSKTIAGLAGLSVVPVIALSGPAISAGDAFASTRPSIQTAAQHAQAVPGINR